MFCKAVLTTILGLAVACACSLSAVGLARPEPDRKDGRSPGDFAARLRRPVALAMTKDGKCLFVANQESGTVSAIHCGMLKLAAEYDVGRKLSDLAITPDGKRLLAVDQAADELVVLAIEGDRLKAERRIKVAASPVSVQCLPDGKCCAVASLWSRKVTVLSLSSEPAIMAVINIPFAPRKQLALGKEKLVVTDAFGGNIALIDVAAGVLESVRKIPAQNIRGLALGSDHQHLWLTEQVLNSQGHAQVDDIRWGNLITNNVLSLRLTAVLDPKADILSGSDRIHLGDVDHGTADPAGIVEHNGRLAVALSGIGEVTLGDQAGDNWQFVVTGGRPTAMISSPDGKRLFAANTSADSISIIDPDKASLLSDLKLGPRPPMTSAQRGENLFHDAKLSHQGWLSCQSCHPDGHTSGKLADTLGDNSYGTPKRILSLRGVGATGPWAWNGSMSQLEKQVEKSITSTMQGHKPTPQQVEDLTAYLKTLPPAPAVGAKTSDEMAVHRGQEVFARTNCSHCHTPPLFTSKGTYDVGLQDETRNRTFNPPSLRGVSQGGPYFHDGRAASLKEVFSKYRHQLKSDLSNQDIADLVAYLATL